MSKRSLPARLFENSPDCGSSTAVADGGSAKASPACVCRTARHGTARLAEVHWYEAHGIGRKELKIKRYIE